MTKPPRQSPGMGSTKAAAIRAMTRDGISVPEIAGKLGLSPNHVYSSLSRDRAEGRMPVVRRLKPEAGDTLHTRTTSSEGLIITADALHQIGIKPGQQVVVVYLCDEIRILSPETAAERLRST